MKPSDKENNSIELNSTLATPIWKSKIRIERIRGSRVDTEPTVWGFDAQVYDLLWTGEEAMKKACRTQRRQASKASKIYQEQP